jgi:hypothetical protein
MNSLQKAFLDGASVAYTDVADKVESMLAKAPAELKEVLEIMRPFGEACRKKAIGLYAEAENMEKGTKH